jgi:hypothetical protein
MTSRLTDRPKLAKGCQFGIERTTGRARKTIHRYVKTAAKFGRVSGGAEPGEDRAARVAKHVLPPP